MVSVIFYNSITIYCPLSDVPKMPTASSAQMSRRTTRRATQIAIRYLILFIFLITSSHIRPVPSNRAPATTKSNRVQFTSSVNCIAINGMSNKITEVSTIIISSFVLHNRLNVINTFTLLTTFIIRIVADRWLHSCYVARKLKRAIILEFTTNAFAIISWW